MTSEQLFYDKKTGFDRLTDEDKQVLTVYSPNNVLPPGREK